MKSIENPCHELVYSSELDRVRGIAKQLPALFEYLSVVAPPSFASVACTRIPCQEKDTADDTEFKHEMSVLCKQRGGKISESTLSVFDGETPLYAYQRDADGTWRVVGSSDSDDFYNDSGMIAFVSASTPRPDTELAKVIEGEHLDSPCRYPSFLYYMEAVGRNNAAYQRSTRVFDATRIGFSPKDEFEDYKVELVEVIEGSSEADLAKASYVLSVQRPCIHGDKVGVEHLQLMYKKWDAKQGTAYTEISFIEEDGSESELYIDDATEFFDQMRTALNHLFESNQPALVAAS